MTYRKTEDKDGLPAISNNRGILGDPSIRRSLTRLDDLDDEPRAHVSFRPLSPKYDHSARATAYRSSSPTRSRSPAPTSHNRSSPVDRMRSRDDLHRRDSPARFPQQSEHASEKLALENSKGEIAALHVKVENLTSKLREVQIENDANVTRLRDMKSTLELARENEARQTALAESLKEKLRDLEMARGSLETSKSRTEATVQQITDEKQQLQEKIRELDGRIRSYLQDRENAEVKASSWEKRYQESLVTLRGALGVDYNESVDVMRVKIQEMMSENTMLKGKLCTAQESLANSELEAKASRETITRLVSEINNEQSHSSKYKADIDHISRARDASEAGRRDLERECNILRERLDASQRAWNATKRELEEKTKIYSSLDHELRDNSLKVRSVQSKLDGFLEQLGVMLHVSPSEDLIKDRIRQLQGTTKDVHTTAHSLESKIGSLNEQLKVTFEQRGEAEKWARRCELDVKDLEERLRRAERELANADAYRDGLRGDKEKFLRFMERMGEIMKMDRISAEVGYDMNGEALLARAVQLTKMEADALADRSTHIYNLQRKIKTMKEQLESKDLHLDLLRKKITQLEEKVVNRSDVEKEKDAETIKSRRLEKTCEKYSQQLEEARMEITDLKAQLLESTKYKVDNQDLVAHCEKLESRLNQLDRIRQKQAKKITVLKEDMHSTESGGEHKLSKAESAIDALSSELRTTKALLDDMAKRERQLVDLRTVIARMLGLDVNTLAVPDYEIISRMEKLIQAHHAHALTNWTMDQTLESMEDGLRAGYPEAKIYLGEPRSHEQVMHERRSRSPEKKRAHSPEKRRTRSPSPAKVDTRKY